MFHLSLRVAWHDNGWDGTVCKQPTCNSFCSELDRIAAEKNPAKEERLAGKHFSVLAPDQQPPCKAESATFMSAKEWTRIVQHPYQDNKHCRETHGHLRPTPVPVRPYSTFAVPFWWMLTKNQDAIDEALAAPLPADEPAPLPQRAPFYDASAFRSCGLTCGVLQEPAMGVIRQDEKKHFRKHWPTRQE